MSQQEGVKQGGHVTHQEKKLDIMRASQICVNPPHVTHQEKKPDMMVLLFRLSMASLFILRGLYMVHLYYIRQRCTGGVTRCVVHV